MALRFTPDSRAASMGRERIWIDYGDRDRLGSILFHQGEWYSDFRFNGKNFEFRHQDYITEAMEAVRETINKELAEQEPTEA